MRIIGRQRTCTTPQLYQTERWAKYPEGSWCTRIDELLQAKLLRSIHPCDNTSDCVMLTLHHDQAERSVCGTPPLLSLLGGRGIRRGTGLQRVGRGVVKHKVTVTDSKAGGTPLIPAGSLSIRGLKGGSTLEELLSRSARYISTFQCLHTHIQTIIVFCGNAR